MELNNKNKVEETKESHNNNGDPQESSGAKSSTEEETTDREIKKRKHENHRIDNNRLFDNMNTEQQNASQETINCDGKNAADKEMPENSTTERMQFDQDEHLNAEIIDDINATVDASLEEMLQQIGDDIDNAEDGTMQKFKFKRKFQTDDEPPDLNGEKEKDKRQSGENSAERGVEDSNDSSTNLFTDDGVRADRESSPSSASDGGQMDESLEENATGTSTDNDTSILAGRHNWFSQKALKKREYGASNYYSPDWFRYKAIGSLHMVQRFELMSKLENHEGCVNCLHFNASGTRLASGSDDLNVCLWDWSLQKPLITFASGHRGNVFQAKFMPLSGDCHIVTCARDGQVRLAELSVQGHCKSTRKLARHDGAAHKLALELDSPHVFLTCGEDGVVYEIDLRDPKPNKLLVCKESTDRDRKIPLYSIHSHPRNPHLFAVCGRDQYNRIYDKRRINDATAVKKLCPEHLVNADSSFKANITCLVFNHDGSQLLASYNDDDIFLFDVESNAENSDKVLHRYTGHRNNATVKGVNFYGPSSEFVVSGSDCGHIYFWDTQTEEIVQYLAGDEQGVINVLEPHPTAAFLATSGLDHDVKIWAPSNENPKFDRKLLTKLTKRNAKDRDADRRQDSEMIDSHMLYLLLSRMRRSGRRRRSQSGEHQGGEGQDDDGSHNASDDSGPGTDTDDDGEGPPIIQCRTS